MVQSNILYSPIYKQGIQGIDSVKEVQVVLLKAVVTVGPMLAFDAARHQPR